MTIRRLRMADADAYRALRLHGLRHAPAAFASSHDAEAARPLAAFADRLEEAWVVGGFDAADRLIAVLGLRTQTGVKLCHKADLWGVYVHPEARGNGLSRVLLDRAIDHARDAEIEAILLAVSADNAAAIAVYTRAGFVIYGREPRSLRLDETYVDELLMRLPLGRS